MFCSNCGNEISNNSKFCPHCGEKLTNDNNKNLPEGSELLDGLYIVQDFLSKISVRLNEFWKLERYYRKTKDEFKTETIVEKGQYGLFYAGISYSVVSLIPCLVTGNIEGLVIGLLATFLFWKGKTKGNKKYFNIGLALLLFLAYTMLTAIPKGFRLSTAAGIGAIIFYGGGLIIGALASRYLVKKYNTKVISYNYGVNASNSEIDAKRKKLSDEINLLNDQMQLKTASWFPTDYYIEEAVDAFIGLVKNHEVDTVKEMVSVYKKDKYRSDVVLNLNTMNQKIDQSLFNQEKMIKLQKISNVLLLGNLVTNMVTASRVGEVVENTNSMASNLRGMSAGMNNMSQRIDGLSSSIGKAQADINELKNK